MEPVKKPEPANEDREIAVLLGWVVCGFVIGVIFLFAIVASGTL
jgi:hypothetical protein